MTLTILGLIASFVVLYYLMQYSIILILNIIIQIRLRKIDKIYYEETLLTHHEIETFTKRIIKLWFFAYGTALVLFLFVIYIRLS